MPLAEPVIELRYISWSAKRSASRRPRSWPAAWPLDRAPDLVPAERRFSSSAFARLLYFVLPTLIFTITGEGWAALVNVLAGNFSSRASCFAPGGDGRPVGAGLHVLEAARLSAGPAASARDHQAVHLRRQSRCRSAGRSCWRGWVCSRGPAVARRRHQ